jgi:hypothetical protein
MGTRSRVTPEYGRRGRVVEVLAGTVAVDPPSVGIGAKASLTFTVTGAQPGDSVEVQPPAALETGLIVIACRVSAANTVQVDLYNPTAGAIDGTSRTWGYVVQNIV